MDITAPEKWYSQDELTVKSWASLKKAVDEILIANRDRQWVWRGQPDANFSLTSSLYRRLTKRNNNGTYKFPSELEMQNAERKLLEFASGQFRLGMQDPVNLFAQLQHLGAPTRFIDVTRNPYAAVWFAAQPSPDFEDCDARIFAFGLKNVDVYHPAITQTTYSGMPVWFDKSFDNWGQGNLSVWFPPFGMHQRVFAQNAGFIFDGLPVFGPGSNSNYTKRGATPNSTNKWSKAEISRATCIDVNFVNWKRKARIDSQKLPVYTIRIPARNRTTILRALERETGITAALLFPGIDGLAQVLSAKNLDLDI